MLKSNIGWSTQEDAYLSGKDSAAKAVVDLVQTKVAFVYTSVDYNVEKVLEGAKSELGTAPIIGCTSSGGIIVPDGFITSDHGFAGIMAFGDPDMTVGVAGSKKGKSARETGRKVALEAMKNAGTDAVPSYFYMVASPGEEEDYVKGIEDVIGNVPFFGGSAADNTVEGKWSIYTGNEIFSDGVAVAFFYTDKPMANVYTGAYHETTNSGIITKVDGKRTLVEIDGVPAMKKYAEWTGKKLKDLNGGNLLVETITAPLGVKDRLGDLIAIRHPMNGNKDYSMNIGNHLAVNTAVIQMQGSVDELIDSTGKTLKETKKSLEGEPAAYLLVHCGGRKLGIGDRIEEVVKKLKKEAGDTPFMTIFTFGEYGQMEHGVNTCGGLMLSFTAFGK
ncbi:MAG: FIST signal transduction protein [Clostridia bacterium]